MLESIDRILTFAVVCSVKMVSKFEILSVFRDVYATLTHDLLLHHHL